MTRGSFAVSSALAMLCAGHAALAASPGAAPETTPQAAVESPSVEPPASPLPLTDLQRARKHTHGVDKDLRFPTATPIDFKLQVLDGPDFRLTKYRGRVVVLNVFATWCGPCRVEQPALTAFADAHADDTTVIGIDDGEQDDTVRGYRKHFGITYPIAMDRRQQIVWQFYSHGIKSPATIVIRPDGMISCAWVNGANRAWLENERLIALR